MLHTCNLHHLALKENGGIDVIDGGKKDSLLGQNSISWIAFLKEIMLFNT